MVRGTKTGRVKLIFGPEWKRMQKSNNVIIKSIPKELTRTTTNIAGEWKKRLKAEAPVFTGALMNSIKLVKGGAGKAGRGVVKEKFFITVTAPHALELVAGPFRQRWVHKDMRGYGGRTFGDWMSEHNMPPFRGLVVGFPGTTMFGKYDDLWWNKVTMDMITFINIEFPELVNRIVHQVKGL